MTDFASTTTYKVKMANEHFWADYHVNAKFEEGAREQMRYIAAMGELADAADEEYAMAVADDRFDPDRGDYTYKITEVNPADEYDPRADDAPHHVKSGGNG